MSKLNVEKLSDEDIQDLFAEAFEEQIGSLCEISEIECTCKRETGNDTVTVEVMVAGLAGTPTYEAYKAEEVKDTDVSTVVMKRDEEELEFEHDAENDYVLNTNDYVVTYKSV